MGVACSRPKAADTLEPTLPAPKGPIDPDAITLQMDAAMDAAEQRQRELDATTRKRWTPALSSRSPQLEDQHAAATILQAVHRGHRSRKSNARSSKLAQAFDLPPFPAPTPRPSQDAGVDVDARALVVGAIATALTHEAEPPVTPASRVPLHRSRVAGSQDWSIQRYSDRRSNSSRLDDRPTLTQLRAMCAPPEPACSERIDETDPNENPRLRSAATLAAVLEERSVLVALRVRPLSAREATSTCCIACDGDGVKVHVKPDRFEFIEAGAALSGEGGKGRRSCALSGCVAGRRARLPVRLRAGGRVAAGHLPAHRPAASAEGTRWFQRLPLRLRPDRLWQDPHDARVYRRARHHPAVAQGAQQGEGCPCTQRGSLLAVLMPHSRSTHAALSPH